MGRVINNVTNTNDAFRWTASFIKSGRLSSEGFLVLAFAADLSTNHNGSKVFLKSNNNLRYFLDFHSLADRRTEGINCENVGMYNAISKRVRITYDVCAGSRTSDYSWTEKQ